MKSCPFCDGPCSVQAELSSRFVQCQQCAARGPDASTVGAAVKAWDERANPIAAGVFLSASYAFYFDDAKGDIWHKPACNVRNQHTETCECGFSQFQRIWKAAGLENPATSEGGAR